MERLYSIMDVKQSRYGSLMTFATDDAAIRAFQTMLTENEHGSMLAMYPTDYIMVCVGGFDKDTGIIQSLQAPQHVITGYDAIVRAIDETNRRIKLQRALKEGTLPSDAGSSVPDISTDSSSLKKPDNVDTFHEYDEVSADVLNVAN